MDAYISIVLRNIKDLIPKIVGNFLVSSVQSRLQYTIYNEINGKEELMNLLGEVINFNLIDYNLLYW